MLTFIRIHLPVLTAVRSGPINRLRQHRSKVDIDEIEAVGNPWRSELVRLQRSLRGENDQARFGVMAGSAPAHPVPPPPPPLPASKPPKQGTLTDLKIWWGKATVYQTPDPRQLSQFSPAPPKKKNRWLQF